METLRASGFVVHPYHVAVPSFGEWGFALAMQQEFEPPSEPPASSMPLRFLNREALAGMFRFSEDMSPVEVEVNRLDNQRLVRYYESEWRRWQ